MLENHMKDLMNGAYERCSPGSKGSVSHKSKGRGDLESFQAVEEVAKDMQSRGLIHILDIKRESYTGQRYIVGILFRRC